MSLYSITPEIGQRIHPVKSSDAFSSYTYTLPLLVISPSCPTSLSPLSCVEALRSRFRLGKLQGNKADSVLSSLTPSSHPQQRMPSYEDMYQSSRPRSPPLYDEFDTIAEPGRRPQPMFMRRAKTRRSKTAVILSLICVLFMVWGWKSSGISIVSVSLRESWIYS